MKQIDIFGNECEPFQTPVVKKGRPKFQTMQERYDTLVGFRCGDCKHCRATGNQRTYYKCDLWFVTSSEATDIRLKDTACRKYEEKQ